MPNINDIQLIEDFIDGALKGNALESFQNRLKTDTEFALEYEARLKLARLWKDAEEYQQVKKQTREIIQLENNSLFSRHKNSFYILAVAASITLLFGIYWIFIQKDIGLPWEKGDQMAKKSDTIVFQEDKPNKLAKIAFLHLLISPANNQEFDQDENIVFRWKPETDNVEADLVIKNLANKLIVLKESVSMADSQLIIDAGILSPGNYMWYLQDSTYNEHFTIMK